jgi:phospholipid-transporting ATPase
MITAAHIGIGISGLEGQQAARAADYSIGQFKFLRHLLLVHGREAYRRNSYLILYMFYKNVIYVLPIFWYGVLSAFSGTQIYD